MLKNCITIIYHCRYIADKSNQIKKNSRHLYTTLPVLVLLLLLLNHIIWHLLLVVCQYL